MRCMYSNFVHAHGQCTACCGRVTSVRQASHVPPDRVIVSIRRRSEHARPSLQWIFEAFNCPSNSKSAILSTLDPNAKTHLSSTTTCSCQVSKNMYGLQELCHYSFYTLTRSSNLLYSCPNPTVSSTAIVSFWLSASNVLYAGRSRRLKLERG